MLYVARDWGFHEGEICTNTCCLVVVAKDCVHPMIISLPELSATPNLQLNVGLLGLKFTNYEVATRLHSN